MDAVLGSATSTVPTMAGWNLHAYLNVPAIVNVNAKLSPGFKVGELRG